MLKQKERQLENAAAILHRRFGAQALRKASHLAEEVVPPHISTGFPELDAITGCRGVPLGDITLLSGRATSGKLTLVYKTIMNAQHPAQNSEQPNGSTLIAIVDLNHSADPDYLARAGVDLDHSLIIRPKHDQETVDLLLDLARTQDVRAILVDSLSELIATQDVARRLQASLSQLRTLLRAAHCALLLLDENNPPWQRWPSANHTAIVRQNAALHIEMQRESWIVQRQQMIGYRASACVVKSRWMHSAPSVSIDIRFGDIRFGDAAESHSTIRTRETW